MLSFRTIARILVTGALPLMGRRGLLLTVLATIPVVATAQPAPGTLYGIEYSFLGETRLVEVNPATGEHVQLYGSLPPFDDLTYDPITDRLMGPSLLSSQILTIDPITGEIEALGAPGALILSVAIHPTTFRIYGVDPGSALYEIDRTSGAATPIGDTGFVEILSIAFDPAGQLTGLSTLLPSPGGMLISEVVSIDLATGAATPLGIPAQSLSGLAFNAIGELFGCNTGDTFSPPSVDFASIFTLDPLLGQISTSIMTDVESFRGIAFWGESAGGFLRGDANLDGGFDVSDVVYLLAALFVPGSPQLGCEDAGDANDDGVFDVSDGVYALAALFVPGSSPIPIPAGPDCGIDPTADGLECSQICP